MAKKKIAISVMTCLGSYVPVKGEFDHDDNKLTMVMSESYLEVVDFNPVVENDKEKIILNVQGKKIQSPKYKDYDVDTIELDEVRFNGNMVTCYYTINTGTYFRQCVGVPSQINRRKDGTYIALPPVYCGEVCW